MGDLRSVDARLLDALLQAADAEADCRAAGEARKAAEVRADNAERQLAEAEARALLAHADSESKLSHYADWVNRLQHEKFAATTALEKAQVEIASLTKWKMESMEQIELVIGERAEAIEQRAEAIERRRLAERAHSNAEGRLIEAEKGHDDLRRHLIDLNQQNFALKQAMKRAEDLADEQQRETMAVLKGINSRVDELGYRYQDAQAQLATLNGIIALLQAERKELQVKLAGAYFNIVMLKGDLAERTQEAHDDAGGLARRGEKMMTDSQQHTWQLFVTQARMRIERMKTGGFVVSEDDTDVAILAVNTELTTLRERPSGRMGYHDVEQFYKDEPDDPGEGT